MAEEKITSLVKGGSINDVEVKDIHADYSGNYD
jgi:hypothetical protein